MTPKREWLVKARKRAGLSQRALAEAVEVTVRTVRTWEAGEHDFYDRHRQPMAKGLGMTLGELHDAEAAYQRGDTAGADLASDMFPAGDVFSSNLPTVSRAASVRSVDGGLVVDPDDAVRTTSTPGLIVAEVGGQQIAVDARRTRRRLTRSMSDTPTVAPSAYSLDDLTTGIAWAIGNLDEALLCDDARLHATQRRLRGAKEVVTSAESELHPVSKMWLGSAFCAHHILANINQLTEAPSFWTQERRGEEASNWLLFTHKLAYLHSTAIKYEGAEMGRAFCIPADAVAVTAASERTLLLLAAALIESFGIEVTVCTEPGYTAVEGCVLDGDRQALVASWVGVEALWHVGVTRDRPAIREFADAVGYAHAHSITAAKSPPARLRALADYLSLDWGWLVRRCKELGEHGTAGLAEPCSRLLSTAGVDRACRYVGSLNQAA